MLFKSECLYLPTLLVVCCFLGCCERNTDVDDGGYRGVFDISLIASIASHLSYWGDEDVNHFIISQLLSRQRVMKKGGKGKQQWSSVKIDD